MSTVCKVHSLTHWLIDMVRAVPVQSVILSSDGYNFSDRIQCVPEWDVRAKSWELSWTELNCKRKKNREQYIMAAHIFHAAPNRTSCSHGYDFFSLLAWINVIFYIYKNNTNRNILLYLSANSRFREHWVRTDCQINWVIYFFFILSSSCVGSSIKTNRFTAFLL